MAWLPRLKIYRNAATDIRQALRFTEKRRGELAHAAVERLAKNGFDPADPLLAARLATRQVLNGERLDPVLRARLGDAIEPMKLFAENYLEGEVGFSSDEINGTEFFLRLPPAVGCTDA